MRSIKIIVSHARSVYSLVHPEYTLKTLNTSAVCICVCVFVCVCVCVCVCLCVCVCTGFCGL